MKQITFYDYGIEDILNGCKNATIRSTHEDHYQVGDLLRLCRQNGDCIGYIRILSKQYFRFEEIDNNIAKLENWKDAETIKKRLCFTYGSLQNDHALVRYSFIYLPHFELTRSGVPRGHKVFLKNDEIITIVSSNVAKLKRLEQAMNLVNNLSNRTLKVSSKETDQLEQHITRHAVEIMALEKARHFSDKLNEPVLASDDDLIILKDDKPVFVSELRRSGKKRLSDHDVFERIFRLLTHTTIDLPVIIRTGIAISVPKSNDFATAVVYRNFVISNSPKLPKMSQEDGFPLNSLLSPRDESCASLIQPLVNGIREIFEVKCE